MSCDPTHERTTIEKRRGTTSDCPGSENAIPVEAGVVNALHREMENISRGPTFGDFVTTLTGWSMQDNTVARLQSTRVKTTLSPIY